jgi:ABC-type uncharacterized transport system substrate-binding protein
MKALCRKISVSVAVILFLSFSTGFAADKKPYPTSPPAKVTKKWRIGYYEGGHYKNYPITLTGIVNSLSELGWIEPIMIPQEEDTGKIWVWLSANIKSRYIEFPADAYYSYNWKEEYRTQTKQTVIRRLKEGKDIDLMIAMGTQAGQDLANNEHAVPTIVCSVSNAVDSKIVRSVEDSGFDHIHARLDPKRYVRQIESFHDIIGFKRLGVAFADTVAGRTYSAIDDIRKVAKERKFEIIECHIIDGPISPELQANTIECVKTLAPKIDAFYLTSNRNVNKETLPKIISIMNAVKVPIFSQMGSDEVRQGTFMSIATSADLKSYGKFHAEGIAKIINGAKPRDLDQVCEAPPKIAFNKAAAKVIDLKDDVYQLLLKTAHEVYDKTEVSK